MKTTFWHVDAWGKNIHAFQKITNNGPLINPNT
jgi:hypothetical protein